MRNVEIARVGRGDGVRAGAAARDREPTPEVAGSWLREHVPMEKLWSADGQEERMRPGPTEPCSECGKVIGDDPDADFYAPLAGPSRAVCGDCSVKLDDESLAAEAAADDATYDEEAANEVEDSEAPIGAGPLPEQPPDAEPVTTPIRRGRARSGSAS